MKIRKITWKDLEEDFKKILDSKTEKELINSLKKYERKVEDERNKV